MHAHTEAVAAAERLRRQRSPPVGFTCAFTTPTSVLVTTPLQLTSLRKFDPVTATIGFTSALTAPTSVLVTTPLPVTSPRRTPMEVETTLLRFPAVSLTSVRLTVIVCSLLTFLRLTIT